MYAASLSPGSLLEVIFGHFRAKMPKGGTNGAKSPKKGHPKIDAKIDAEKYGQMMPKCFKSDAKRQQKWIMKSIYYRNGYLTKTMILLQ